MKIGTVGTGSIVETILESVQKVEGISCAAVYSRKAETGRKLADKFQIQKVYTDYDAMCQDELIDFIYIASPNSLHYEQTKKALEYGKNVICEKPFTPYLSQANELIDMARQKHLFLFEGITTMFQPNYQLVKEHLASLGSLKMALCTFCQYSRKYDAFKKGELPNVFNPAFAGGALMDINLYNIYFIVGLFGKPDQVSYFAGKHENGIDTHGILILQYPDFICECAGAKDSWCENSVQLLGDNGYIRITPGSSNCQEIQIVQKGKEEICFHQEQTPWFYEIEGLVKLVEKKDYTECYERLTKTLEVVEVLEQARQNANIPF